MWIYFIEGRGQSGKLVAVAIGLTSDPEGQVASFNKIQPFACELMGLEKGSRKRLEALRERFADDALNGPWFKPKPSLVAYVEALEVVDRSDIRARRVSLDLSASDFAELEFAVAESGATTKQRYLRRAFKSYGALVRYQAAGYKIQAIKGGKLIQFDDLDYIPEP